MPGGTQGWWHVPRLLLCPQTPQHVPTAPAMSPNPAPSPIAQHCPHSMSPPGWGGGQSLLPISAEEFITGTAGPCWGGQAARKINPFLPSLPAQEPSLPQLAGGTVLSWGVLGDALHGGSFATPNPSQPSVSRL